MQNNGAGVQPDGRSAADADLQGSVTSAAVNPAVVHTFDTTLVLDNRDTVTANSQQLRKASALLAQALDHAQLTQPISQSAVNGSVASATLLLPTVTMPQIRTLLDALDYSNSKHALVAWACQQTLETLQRLAEAAHALACTDLLVLADETLTQRAVVVVPAVPPLLPTILLTPGNVHALYMWARPLGLERFTARAEEALQAVLPKISASQLSKVYADLQPAGVVQYLAEQSSLAVDMIQSAQELVQADGDAYNGEEAAGCLSEALEALARLPDASL